MALVEKDLLDQLEKFSFKSFVKETIEIDLISDDEDEDEADDEDKDEGEGEDEDEDEDDSEDKIIDENETTATRKSARLNPKVDKVPKLKRRRTSK